MPVRDRVLALLVVLVWGSTSSSSTGASPGSRPCCSSPCASSWSSSQPSSSSNGPQAGGRTSLSSGSSSRSDSSVCSTRAWPPVCRPAWPPWCCRSRRPSRSPSGHGSSTNAPPHPGRRRRPRTRRSGRRRPRPGRRHTAGRLPAVRGRGRVLGRGHVARAGSPAPPASLTVWSGLIVPIPLALLACLVNGPAAVGSALTHLSLVNWASTAYTAAFASPVRVPGSGTPLLGRHKVAEVAPPPCSSRWSGSRPRRRCAASGRPPGPSPVGRSSWPGSPSRPCADPQARTQGDPRTTIWPRD